MKDMRAFNQSHDNVFAGMFLEDRAKKRADPAYKGPWTTYIETLPMTDCFNFPVNFGAEEMAMLDGCHRVSFETSIRK